MFIGVGIILIPNIDMKKNKFQLRDISSPSVLKAMYSVVREKFVLPEYKMYAYDDRPLPIGLGQTISQPYMVAFMTELLNLNSDSIVLEIGTGSGYQTAILAEIVDSVYTVEIIEELYIKTNKLLQELGYKNIITKLDDGYNGWEKYSPFDAIIVTCAVTNIPPELIKQLKVGGKICIPVGEANSIQTLYKIEKKSEDDISVIPECSVRFVPLTHTKDSFNQNS